MEKILITNDDGIDSDGLLRLVKASVKYGEVWVVAPDSQKSASSHDLIGHTAAECRGHSACLRRNRPLQSVCPFFRSKIRYDLSVERNNRRSHARFRSR